MFVPAEAAAEAGAAPMSGRDLVAPGQVSQSGSRYRSRHREPVQRRLAASHQHSAHGPQLQVCGPSTPHKYLDRCCSSKCFLFDFAVS